MTTTEDILDDPRVTAQIDVGTLTDDEKHLLRVMLDPEMILSAGYATPPEDPVDMFLERCTDMDYEDLKMLSYMLELVHGVDLPGFDFDFLHSGDESPSTYEISMRSNALHCWLCCVDDVEDADPERYRGDGQTPLRAALSAMVAINDTRQRTEDAFRAVTALLPVDGTVPDALGLPPYVPTRGDDEIPTITDQPHPTPPAPGGLTVS